MAMKQQYASCKMHTAAVLSHKWVNCRETPTPKPQFASCMIHNDSFKWLCSGNERSLFHMEWNFAYLQTLHVLACTGKCTYLLIHVVLNFPYSSMTANMPWIVHNLLCDSLFLPESALPHSAKSGMLLFCKQKGNLPMTQSLWTWRSLVLHSCAWSLPQGKPLQLRGEFFYHSKNNLRTDHSSHRAVYHKEQKHTV